MKTFLSKIWTSIKTATKRIGAFARKHKIASAFIVLIIIGLGYWGYSALAAESTGTEYVLAATAEGPLQATVTGSGQVTSNDTLSISPQGSASGEITEIDVTPGEQIAAGAVIARLDDTDAAEAVTSAQQDLESAQISYEQTLTSSQTSVSSDQTSLTTAEANTAGALATTYTDLPTVMNGLNGVLHNLSTLSGYTAEESNNAYANYINSAQSRQDYEQEEQDYATAVSAYQQAQAQYNSLNTSNLSPTTADQLAQTTIQLTQTVDTAVRDELTFLNYINAQVVQGQQIIPSQLAGQISSVTSYQTTISNDSANVTSADTALVSAEQNLAKDTQSLSPSGGTSLTVQSAQLAVAKAQAALTQAETTETDYTVTAPFSGTIASVPVNQYDQAGSGTVVATLITTGNYVDLSLNEADITKIQIGQPVTITFDAISGLTATGTVAEVDPVGTVSQGVVTYDVKIGLNTADSRIKPGMTADATIITSSVPDAIQVSSSAVQTNANGTSYVEVATLKNASSTVAAMKGGTGTRRTRTGSSTSAYTGFARGDSASSTGVYANGFGGSGNTSSSTSFSASAVSGFSRSITVPAGDVTISEVPIVIGLSTDTMVQVTSGLRPGQFVVTSTVSGKAAKASTSSSGGFSLFGGARGTTGATRTGAAAGGGFTGGGTAGGGETGSFTARGG